MKTIMYLCFPLGVTCICIFACIENQKIDVSTVGLREAAIAATWKKTNGMERLSRIGDIENSVGLFLPLGELFYSMN